MQQSPLIVTVGEILVEFVSHQKNCGLQAISPYSGPYPSGAPAIFLDQAAKMGARTRLYGGLGADGFGRAVLARLASDGVDTRGIRLAPELPTGVAFVSYYEDGRRDFIFHLNETAADNFPLPPTLPEAERTWLHVSAASLGNARLRQRITEAVAQVRAAGGKITCDPNARPELMRDDAAVTALREIMACSQVLLPSTSDLAFLCPGQDEDSALAAIRASGAELVVLKRGAGGASVFAGDTRLDLPGHGVTEIDPTGAGDCFCGTFVALLAQGASLEKAAVRANAAGALAVTRRGPMEGNSTPAAIDSFLSALEVSA